MATAKTITMDDLLANEQVGSLTQGEVVDGTIMTVRKHEVLIDLGPLGVGFVPRREIGFGQKLEEGASVTASVVDTEMDNGYSLLVFVRPLKTAVGTKYNGWWTTARRSRLWRMTQTAAVS